MAYHVGDIVNGHILASDNTWHPVSGGTATATLEPAAAPVPAPTSKPFYRRWWFIGVVGVATIAIIASAAGGKGGASSTASTDQAAASATAAAAAPAAPAAAPAAAPEMTVAQEQALKKAQSYLSYSGFSESGLVKQLTFDGFSDADAKWAVTHAEVDWNAEVVEKAKSYLEYSSFSRAGLLKQLQFDGFTQAQAAHAVNAVGLK